MKRAFFACVFFALASSAALADISILGMPPVAGVGPNDSVAIVQGGVTSRATVAQFAGGLSGLFATLAGTQTFTGANTFANNVTLTQGQSVYFSGPYVGQIGSNIGASIGSVTGNLFGIAQKSVAWVVAVDQSGNVGIAGNYYAASERRLKENVVPLERERASWLVDHTQIVRYCYIVENCVPHETRHIGFIADDTALDLAPQHKSFDVNAVASVTLQALRETRSELADLRAENQALKARLDRAGIR